MGKARLRELLIEIQKEETLKELLGSEYYVKTKEEKEHYLSFVISQIEQDVDKMLNEHVEQHLRSLPENKSHRNLMIFYTIANVVLTGAAGFAVNEKTWVFVVILYILLCGVQVLPYIINKK
ncbi:hypothetical protein [Oceanobacillus timonensis]|uniref:hypothetical protein n=1 Tax=Oceanobacillus timonensis TaxID=1926285 RepID=UPI0009B9C164|nr:hypothetical protein [Oceanobacillus timonensis]